MIGTQEEARRILQRLARDLEEEDAAQEAARPPWILEGMRLVAGTRVYYVTALSLAQIREKVWYTARQGGPRILAETDFMKQEPGVTPFVKEGLSGIILGIEGPLQFEPVGTPRCGRISLLARERPLLLQGHATFGMLRERLKAEPGTGTFELPVSLVELTGWSHE